MTGVIRGLSIGICLLSLLLTPVSVGAEPSTGVQVTVTLGPGVFTVGDVIPLHLLVQYPSDFQVQLPPLGPLLGNLEVLKEERKEEDLNGERRLQVLLAVTAFAPGSHDVPSIPVIYRDAGGGQGEAMSSPLVVSVGSVLPAGPLSGDIRDLKPQVDFPLGVTPFLPLAPWVGGSLAAALVAYLLAHVAAERLRTLKRGEAPPTAQEVALRELKRIESLEILKKEDTKALFSLVSRCVRQYLESRYSLRALSSTTEELRHEMARRQVDRWQARMVYGLLTECDSVKFGEYQPARSRAESTLTLAYEIVAKASSE